MFRGFHESLVGGLLFPLGNQLLNRRNVLPAYREMRRTEHYPRERLRELQERRLRKLIDYVYEWIPFYRSRMDELGLAPEDIQKCEDIALLPPLSRQNVIEHRHELVDRRLRQETIQADDSSRGAGVPIAFGRFRGKRIVRNTSSGSTGAPTVFYEDGSRTAMNWAFDLRYRNWFGVAPGAREARFARVSVDYLPGARDLLLRKALWNQLILPGVNLGDEDYDFCRRSLAAFRPRVLWGFTSALAGLAEHLLARKETLPFRPEVVITWAAPLYEHEEKSIREAFRCPVTNVYGAREVGHIGCRCPEGTLHINEDCLLVEEERGAAVGEGDVGEILVTNLDLSVMPFIRYRMGDLGKISVESCACGLTLGSLSNFLGRTGETFITKTGRMISPNFWCRTFMDPRLGGKVCRFQVHYESPERVCVRIVRGGGYGLETEKVLLDGLRRNLPPPMEVALSYVEDIAPQLSGKYQMVVNECGAGGGADAGSHSN